MSYTIDELLKTTDNEIIQNTFVTAQSVCNMYNNIMVSISGGSDSDIMMDIMYKVDKDHKCHYVFFDTGIEYQATKDHIDYLEHKYGVVIERIRPVETVGFACRKYGQPLISKYVSGQISTLQSIGFEWDDTDDLDLLVNKYGDSYLSAFKWWTGNYGYRYKINKDLKEYMVLNPPKFKVSNYCCSSAKKNPSEELIKECGFDCVVLGVRKQEGGLRAMHDYTCFDNGKYAPLFEWTDKDKEEYELTFVVTHNKCYTEYGFKRTGCCCCPYSGKDLALGLMTVEKYEPKLYKAVNGIFKDSIEWQMGFEKWKSDKMYNKMKEKWGSR